MILKALGIAWVVAIAAALLFFALPYIAPNVAAGPVFQGAMQVFFSAGILLLGATVPWFAIGFYVAMRKAVRSKGSRRFSVAVYELKDRILVHPWQRTNAGLGVASEPYLSLPLGADDGTLGSTVLQALSDSGRTVSHARSAAVLPGARFVTVERSASGFRIEKGFEPLPLHASHAELGALVRRGLAECAVAG